MCLAPWRGFTSFTAAAVLLTAVGCGSERTTVLHGTVLHKGSVVPGGIITFATDKADAHGQKMFTGPIDGEGNYRIAGLPLDCTAKVGVDNQSLRTTQKSPADAAVKYAPDVAAKMKESNAGAKAQRYRQLPDKYRSPETSGVTVKIKEADQKEDITLP